MAIREHEAQIEMELGETVHHREFLQEKRREEELKKLRGEYGAKMIEVLEELDREANILSTSVDPEVMSQARGEFIEPILKEYKEKVEILMRELG